VIEFESGRMLNAPFRRYRFPHFSDVPAMDDASRELGGFDG
jgi:CO/xanthine dehydrogenase Mo-binding subunit